MTRRLNQVGFSQRVRLEWLEAAAGLVLAGISRKDIEASLDQLLREKVSVGGEAQRSNRSKVVTILLKTWLTVPAPLEPFRLHGLNLLTDLPRAKHIALHWGMVMAAYPFWAGVAQHVGRLMKLQGKASAAQIQRRVREQYGERETVARATRRVIRSFADWRVLTDEDALGVYSMPSPLKIEDQKLIAWLCESVIRSVTNGSASLRELLDSPCTFPFSLTRVSGRGLAQSSARMEVVRDGPDGEIIALRND